MSCAVYVSLQGRNRVRQFQLDSTSGALEPRAELRLRGGPAPLAIAPSRRRLYVGCRKARRIVTLHIDPDGGALTPVGKIRLDADPCYLGIDRSGRFLLSAYYSAGVVAVHAIDTDGVVRSPPVEWIATGRGAHAFVTDRSNSFAYAPHVAWKAANAIFQFRFDETTGRVRPNEPVRIVPPGEDGPRHLALHPVKGLLYCVNEQGCSVTVYAIDPSTGNLTPAQTVPTLPDGFRGSNSCAQLRITPSANALFVANRGHDSIAGFAIDDETGHLWPTGWAPAEPAPRALDVDPTGSFLLAAGLASGRLATYRIDADAASLRRIGTRSVGAGPMWITTVALE